MSTKKKKYKRFNEALISKIDNMPSNDNSPYAARKRETVTNSELFDNDIYNRKNDDNQDYKWLYPSIVLGCIAVLLIVLLLVY